MTPDDLIARAPASNLRGRGGAGFPMGRKASLIDRKSAQADVPRRQRRRVRARAPSRTGRSCARVPHRLIEGCLIAAHAIEAKHVFIYIRGEYLTEYEILQARGRRGARGRALRRRRRHRAPRRRRLHLRRGDSAARLARRPARPAPPSAAVPAHAGPVRRADADQQRLHDRHACRRSWSWAQRDSRRSGPSRRPARPSSRLSGNVVQPGQLRARAGHDDPRADLRRRRRLARRPPAEGDHPRRLVGAGR